MDDPPDTLPSLPGPEELETWLDLGGWPLKALGAMVVALLILSIVLKVLRVFRPRGPIALHPKLQPYAGGQGTSSSYGPVDEQLVAQRRQQAARILATSSTDRITGYEIIEQVEAVFVDGFRRPEESLEGLKAVAAMKGANALTNVHHERTTAGKASASGDAVIVRKLGQASTTCETSRTGEPSITDEPKPTDDRRDDRPASGK